MSASPQLSMFSVLRISPSPPRTLGLLSAPPTELCNYHDNYSQQRPDSADWGKEGTMYLPVKASSRCCCLLKGLCQNSPLPTPLVFPSLPEAWSTHPLLRQSLGYLALLTKMASLLLFWTLPVPGAGWKPRCRFLMKSDRYILNEWSEVNVWIW